MKKLTIVLLIFTVISVGEISAQSKRESKFNFGVHTGFDVGGAVPWPLKEAVGGGNKMSATPHLVPEIGVGGGWNINNNWSLNAQVTYKTVSIDAKILTLRNGQKFKDGDLRVTFYGQASTSMMFRMLEFPVYLKYKIDEKNRVYAGGYASYLIKGKFVANAYNGRIENPDNGSITIVKPDNPLENDFSENLGKLDVGMVLGYERKLLNRVFIDGRFTMGFKDIFKKGENYLDYSMWQMRGSVMVTYVLFGRH